MAAKTTTTGIGLPMTSSRHVEAEVPIRRRGAYRCGIVTMMIVDLVAFFTARSLVINLSQLDATAALLRTTLAYTPLTWILICCWFALRGHYSSREHLTAEVGDIAGAVLFAFLLAFSIWGDNKYYPYTLFRPWLVSSVLIVSARYCLRRVLYRLRLWNVPSVIIGSTAEIRAIRAAISRDWYRGFVVRSEIDCDGSDPADIQRSLAGLAAAGTVQHVVLTSDCARAYYNCLKAILLQHALSFGIVALRPDFPAGGIVIDRFFGSGLLIMRETKRARTRPRLLLVKRSIDVVGSLILLIVLFPVWLSVAWLLSKEGGPLLYKSPRLGADGKRFYALKFRTMVVNADTVLHELLERDPGARLEWQATFKLRHDPRVTALGRRLRQLSLDELPQLINVLRGEMSLVGPSPSYSRA